MEMAIGARLPASKIFPPSFWRVVPDVLAFPRRWGFVAQIRGRDSLFESCLLAGFHEQAAPHALPHDELVLLQRSSEEAWLSDGVV